jgi:hypothetical protein
MKDRRKIKDKKWRIEGEGRKKTEGWKVKEGRKIR